MQQVFAAFLMRALLHRNKVIAAVAAANEFPYASLLSLRLYINLNPMFTLSNTKKILCAITLTCCWNASHAQDSYERGPAQPLQCRAGEDKQGDQCLPACKDGFEAEDDICIQVCPSNATDNGATCIQGPTAFRKKKHERGAAIPPAGCGTDMEVADGKCLPVCKAGFRAEGNKCQRL